MRETQKSIVRRTSDNRFCTRWFVGDGIDIGCGVDMLWLQRRFFPLMTSCRPWDLNDGDAMQMETVKDNTYDFVHSSHCLEHLVDPAVALKNWVRILKPGGTLVVIIPDEDLYEQGVFPSNKNGDHKWTFTTGKTSSWSGRSIDITKLLAKFFDRMQLIKLDLLDGTYDYDLPAFDQTATALGECAIEFIMRKRTPGEIEEKGRLPNKQQELTDLDKYLLTDMPRFMDKMNQTPGTHEATIIKGLRVQVGDPKKS